LASSIQSKTCNDRSNGIQSQSSATQNRLPCTALVAQAPAVVRKQAHLKFIMHQRAALFRAENDMCEKLGKGVSQFFHPYRGSRRFQIPTPPSPRKKKKRGAQMGLKLCLPYEPLNRNKPGIFFWK
jgi:hypothetical protein